MTVREDTAHAPTWVNRTFVVGTAQIALATLRTTSLAVPPAQSVPEA